MGRKQKGSAAPTVGDMPFLHIHLRAFAHASEHHEAVRGCLAFAAGFNLDVPGEAAAFERTFSDVKSEGHYHNPIHIMEAELTRKADVRRFWKGLFREPSMAGALANECESRLDEQLVFWFRIDKQDASSQVLTLTEGDDAIQVRAKLATYPRDREVGLGFLVTFLEHAASDGGGEPSA